MTGWGTRTSRVPHTHTFCWNAPMRRLIVLLVLVMSGCATTQPDPAAIDPPPTGPNELVFQLVELPGLMPPGQSFKLPRISLYGDGALVLADNASTAVPHPTQRQLTSVGVRRVLQAATDAGLTSQTDYGTPQIADAGASIFTVLTTSTKVVAPTHIDGVTDAQRAARQRLRTFVNNLANLEAWLGNDIAKDSSPYSYTQLAVFAQPQDANPAAPQRPWPLADLTAAGEPHGVGHCQLISGPDLDTIRGAASSAPPYTQWRSGTQQFRVLLRPLLRTEKTCRDLTE
jgi:hypothetical protein